MAPSFGSDAAASVQRRREISDTFTACRIRPPGYLTVVIDILSRDHHAGIAARERIDVDRQTVQPQHRFARDTALGA